MRISLSVKKVKLFGHFYLITVQIVQKYLVILATTQISAKGGDIFPHMTHLFSTWSKFYVYNLLCKEQSAVLLRIDNRFWRQKSSNQVWKSIFYIFHLRLRKMKYFLFLFILLKVILHLLVFINFLLVPPI